MEGIREPLSPVVSSGVYFPLVAGRAQLEETVEVLFPRRGAYRENSFAFSTSFPFGFLEKSVHVTLRREMLVYPSIDPQPGFDDLLAGITGEIETHYRGLGRDFYRIRPYEISESARHVDWKATAHTGALQSIHFRSQGYEFRQPEDGDIYTILKVLALVSPQRGNVPETPADETSFKLVFTAAPGRFAETGWSQALLLTPAALPVPAGGAGSQT